MPWGILVAGPAIVAYVALFLAILYWQSGIRPGELERRRMTILIAGLALFVIPLSVLFALRAPGVQFYWVPVAAAAYLGLRRLGDSGHWLVTPTKEELAAGPARRQAIGAAMRRPVFWLLCIGLTAGLIVLAVSAAAFLP